MAVSRVMFVAGEPSGDNHASQVIRCLREREPACQCVGVGGPAMNEAGLQSLVPFEPFMCMGFVEVVRSLPFLVRARGQLVADMERNKPDALVLVDYASFNMRLLADANRLGVPVVWYIAPKVWAWKPHRTEILRSQASAIACIFPFEQSLFEGGRARVTFVGNPLVEALEATKDIRPDLLAPKPATFHRIALLPGSRRQEVKAMLKPMLDAYLLLRRSYRQLRVVVSRVKWLPDALYEQARQIGGVDIVDEPLGALLQNVDVALVTSGTATLETALRGIPHVIAYKTSALSYRIYRSLVHIDHIGLPNIVAGEKVLPECIQDKVTGLVLATELDTFLSSRDAYQATVRKLLSLRETLGSRKPSEEVARLIVEVTAQNRSEALPVGGDGSHA
jgi:lipid-A-disaccharide synthase